MHNLWRRALTGSAAGSIGSVLLVTTWTADWLAVLVGILAGVAFSLAFRPAAGRPLDSVMAGGTTGIALWVAVNVIAEPVLRGEGAQWEAAGLARLFPNLVGWILFGAVLSLLVRIGVALAERVLGPERPPSVRIAPTPARIVVLGGGFAGVTAMSYLEQRFGGNPAVSFTLVSDTNALLFTPMLAEVAASSLEASHISAPLRTSLRRTRVVRGEVTRIDLERRTVCLAAASQGSEQAEPFDHLVLALGAVSNYLGMEDVRAEAFDFKSLEDAIRIRNHVIEMFECADREPNPAARQAMVTFVIAGGGFAGAELAGGVNDFARGMLAYYPQIPPEEVRVVLVHSRDRILPELGDGLAAYALERMRARGVTFKLNTRVAGARRGAVLLSPDEEIATETLVWTAGTRPNPLLSHLPLEHDRRGAVVVEGTLAVPGHPDVWALGDCAAVPNAENGETSPPTAQFALRQAKTLAQNIQASLAGRPLHPFRFKAIGALCVVGHHTACAEVYGRRFSGFFAWLMWRGIYVGKLPGLERKLHVLADWLAELFFPRDIVQTLSVTRERED